MVNKILSLWEAIIIHIFNRDPKEMPRNSFLAVIGFLFHCKAVAAGPWTYERGSSTCNGKSKMILVFAFSQNWSCSHFTNPNISYQRQPLWTGELGESFWLKWMWHINNPDTNQLWWVKMILETTTWLKSTCEHICSLLVSLFFGFPRRRSCCPKYHDHASSVQLSWRGLQRKLA